MKNIRYILITGFLLVLGACNDDEFLDLYPKDVPVPQNFFVDAKSARMAVNACYEPWTRSYNMIAREMTIFLDGMTDDSYLRQTSGNTINLPKWDITAVHSEIYLWWMFPYGCINQCNFAIENIPLSTDANFTPEKQAPFIAEAKFFRAYSSCF